MSKDKRGRKCKGRHCAWCKPVKNYLTVAEAHAMLLAQNIYWQRGKK